MKPRIMVCSFVLAAALALLPQATAAQSAGADENDGAATATRIEVDEQANIIRFFIDGEESMRLDKAGLHVHESIDYGGTIQDRGHEPVIGSPEKSGGE